MTCSVCGQATLFDGVCVDCSNKRFDDYPRLKNMEEKIKKDIKILEEIIKSLPKDSRAYDMNKYRLLGYQNLISEQPTIEAVK